MVIHAVDKLMEQTRRLAAEYYQTTGKTLTVTPELARFDAIEQLKLEAVDSLPGIDALGSGPREGKHLHIKGRVIFDEGKNTYRIGQFNLERDWQLLLLVLYHADYHPFAIYQIPREAIDIALAPEANSKRSKRGVMSVAKLKALGTLVWTPQEGEINA